MHAARVSRNGQITVPVRLRRDLGVGPGDMIAFHENERGEVVVTKAAPDLVPRPIPRVLRRQQAEQAALDAELELDRIAAEAWQRHRASSRAASGPVRGRVGDRG